MSERRDAAQDAGESSRRRRKLCREKSAALHAVVSSLAEARTARKKPEDLLANNINHQNDSGH
jgi:hypothetical protein